jgi:hypothetical protein
VFLAFFHTKQLLISVGSGRQTRASTHPRLIIITTRSFKLPTIHEVNFNEGKLRCGTGNNIHDQYGYPINSLGHIKGDSNDDPVVQSGDDPSAPTRRYRILITATQNGLDKEWKGRIVAPDPVN